ncbi:MAG: hypothetical protein AAF846_12685 [Chloroflexota bacterium]
MKRFAKLFFAVCIVLVTTMPIIAHGVRINHSINASTGEVTITAAFDTGEVLDEAAVIIFAPDDLINPWSTGVMDETGTYAFTPDYTIEGFWDVQVRKAGHGGLINIEITEDMMPDSSSSAVSSDDNSNSTMITLSDGSEVLITGDVNFSVNGDTITFETASTDSTPQNSVTNQSSTSGFTTAQIVIMSASVIWGFIGTALYFTGRKPKSAT